MSKVEELLTEITELETKAGALEEGQYEELYGLLVQAYSKAKDVIVHLQESTPEPVKVVDTDHVDQLKFEIEEHKLVVAKLQSQVDRVIEVVVPGLT